MPSTSGEGTHTGEMSWASIASAIPAAPSRSFLDEWPAADPGTLETAATAQPTPRADGPPLRREAEVAALVGGGRRAREARRPLRDLAPRVAAEPPRRGLARLRVERADGGGPEACAHSEGGGISRHGSLPTSLRRGCAPGTSATLSRPRPAVTSGGSYLFSALGLGHSVCRCQNIGVAGLVVGDVLV